MLPLHQWLVLNAQSGAEDGFAELQPPAPLPVDWLFGASMEPVLIVNAANALIAQLNPAAANLFGGLGTTLIGAPLVACFEESSALEMQRCLALAQTTGGADSAPLRPLEGGPMLRAQVSLVRAAAETYWLVRLDASHATAPARTSSTVFDAVDQASVGFLMAESGLRVEYANRAFIDMIKVGATAELYGTSVLHWLKFSEADLTRLRDQVADHQAVALLTTHLCPVRQPRRRVEVCAIPVPEDRQTSWGFTVRELPNLN
jgi:nitrogen-specific signal transduction histidine kinase